MLEHVTSVCNLAGKVIEHYPRLNRDWLIAGAVLHDIGKVEELGTSRRLSYTTRGQLVGHVARLEGFPIEIKSMLQHLIVSHHGEIDKAALRRPAWPEAILLHYLDEVDARLEQGWRLIEKGPAGEEWTAYVPSLERQLYSISDNPFQGKESGPMTPEENKLFIQRFVEETINRKNLDAINELVAENFVEHVPFPGQEPGREGLRYAIGVFLSAFPDIQWTLDEQLVEGEKVVAGSRGQGLIAVGLWVFRPGGNA